MTQILDVTGSRRPLPILRAKKALAQMEAGEVLTVLATDGGVPGDFEAFCRQTGHILPESTEADGVFTLVMRHKQSGGRLKMRTAASVALFGILLAGCCVDTMPPEQSQRQGREVVALFEQSCAANGGDGAKVTAWAESRQAQKLAADEVNKLLPGMMESGVQAVWRIQKDGADYYLGLSPDSCSAKTAKADENTVWQQFEELAKRGAQGANVELRADNAAQSPFPIRQLSYAWRPAGSGSETVLTANTSMSDRLPVQAALMLTHQVYHSAPILEQD